MPRVIPRLDPPHGLTGESVGIGTTFGLKLEFWKSVFWKGGRACSASWRVSDTGACCRAGAWSYIGRPPGKASSAGAAADISGYISGAGRGDAACRRRPQRRQRFSSASFEALQYWQSMRRFVGALLTRFFPLCYGSRLGFNFHSRTQYHEPRPLPVRTRSTSLANIFRKVCHAFCLIPVQLVLLTTSLTSAYAQDFRPDLPSVPPQVTPSTNINLPGAAAEPAD